MPRQQAGRRSEGGRSHTPFEAFYDYAAPMIDFIARLDRATQDAHAVLLDRLVEPGDDSEVSHAESCRPPELTPSGPAAGRHSRRRGRGPIGGAFVEGVDLGAFALMMSPIITVAAKSPVDFDYRRARFCGVHVP